MTDAPRDGLGPSGPDRSSGADRGVHFEETIALSDSEYAGLASLAGAGVLVSIVATLLFVPLAVVLFFWVVAERSGNSIVDVATTVVSGLPLSVLAFLVVFAIFYVGTSLLVLVMAVRRGSLTYRDEIHTRVTDSGVTIDRDGGYPWQSAEVTIPFEAITAVEYNDPEGSLKMNLEDVRAEKYIGGRAQDWVRIERRNSPAVYVGSDRPRNLAAVVADLAPGVDRARSFS